VLVSRGLVLFGLVAACGSGDDTAPSGASDAGKYGDVEAGTDGGDAALDGAPGDGVTDADSDTDPFGAGASESFTVGLWCGPPDDQVNRARFQEIADAGFTLTMPWCWGRNGATINKQILDAAQAAGIKASIHDGRMPIEVGGPSNGAPLTDAEKSGLDGIVADYGAHPALASYFVTDEPSSSAFPRVREIVAYLQAKDTSHPTFVNILPDYALGAAYPGYVEQYITTVAPHELVYDNYPFPTEGDRVDPFFNNLAVAGDAARRHQLAFWTFILSVSGDDLRVTNEAEKRWQALQAVTYGGKGILWFTYWTPPGASWGPALIDSSGNRTPQYAEVQKVNGEVKTIGRWLMPASFDDAFGPDDAPVSNDVIATAGAHVTIGLFHDGARHFALVTNRDYQAHTDADVDFASQGEPVWKLDKHAATWSRTNGATQASGAVRVHVGFDAGDGDLYGW
jgi:hypothetical protein